MEIAKTVDFIAGIAQVPKNQLVIGVSRLDVGFEPTGMLHPLSKRIAKNANMVPWLELELSFLGNRDGRSEDKAKKCRERLAEQIHDDRGERGRRADGLADGLTDFRKKPASFQ